MNRFAAGALHENWKSFVPADQKKLFPIGPYFDLVFSPGSGMIHFIAADSFKDLTGFTDPKSSSFYELFQSLLIPDHADLSLRFFGESLKWLQQNAGAAATINQEFNIITRNNTVKRILFQYQLLPSDEAGGQPVAVGKFIDISHLIRDGFPKLALLKDNRIADLITATPEEMLKAVGYRITPRELSMLKLKATGLRAKEIAQQLNLSIMAVYSMIRNLKERNKMDIFPLLHQLKEKGLLSVLGLQTSADILECPILFFAPILFS